MSPSCWPAWSTGRWSPPRRSARGVDFRVLQTLAQYGREQLERSGDAAAARARHASYVANVVEVPDGRHGAAEGTGTARSVSCSTTSAWRWSGPSSRATPTSHAPSRAASAGSGTWAAASTTPGDGSRRRSRSANRRGRAGGSARSGGAGSSAWCTTASVRSEYGAEAVARARALGDPSTTRPGDDAARLGDLRLLSSDRGGDGARRGVAARVRVGR